MNINFFANIFIYKYGQSFTCQGISLNKIEQHINNMINLFGHQIHYLLPSGFAQFLHSMSNNGACHEGYLRLPVLRVSITYGL